MMFFGASKDNYAWYQMGRWSAEPSLTEQGVGNALFGRPRVVQVEQSYLDSLHAELANSRNISNKNYNAAVNYRDEADALRECHDTLLVKANAMLDEQYEERIKERQDYKCEVKRLQAELDAALATAERERQAKETIQNEYNKFETFAFVLASILKALLPAAEAGKVSRPEYTGIKGYADKLLSAYHATRTAPDCDALIDEKYFELEESIKF